MKINVLVGIEGEPTAEDENRMTSPREGHVLSHRWVKVPNTIRYVGTSFVLQSQGSRMHSSVVWETRQVALSEQRYCL